MPVNLMIVSDTVLGVTGLGRLTRELAAQIHAHLPDVFRVATVGAGASWSRHLPWENYPATLKGAVLVDLADIWQDFAGNEGGVLLFIWNASWSEWAANPGILPDGPLRKLLQSPKMRCWGYFPLDADGPLGMIPESQVRIMAGFERVATYTAWAKSVIDKTAAHYQVPLSCHVLPHGTDTAVFFPRDRMEARGCFLEMISGRKGKLDDSAVMLGIMATNSARKNWALGFETCAELVRRGMKVGVAAHANRVQGCWNLMDLAASFGLKNHVGISTVQLTDEQTSWWYAAMDCTLGIGSGEGWGLTLSESLACGRPVIHGNYAGGAEFVPAELLVDPVGWYYEGAYHCRRPVFDAKHWADRVEYAIGKPWSLPERFAWNGGAWSQWEAWLKEGL